MSAAVLCRLHIVPSVCIVTNPAGFRPFLACGRARPTIFAGIEIYRLRQRFHWTRNNTLIRKHAVKYYCYRKNGYIYTH